MGEAQDNRRDRKCLRVLIADDTATIRSSLSALISRIPDVEVVGAAETGAQALKMATDLKPDILTLDIRMPEMNGIKVLESIMREKLAIEVIVLTGLIEEEYRHKCLELGATHFFHKATEFEEMIKILRERASRLNP
jgi:DNA-binding NarL/FixJ family response regulator